jgi:hypothetical protein
VDAHVHFHRVEAVAATLDAAATNFKRAVPSKSALTGYLLLTQGARERVFEELREQRSAGDWQLAPAPGEDETMFARRGELCLAIVCGRQIRANDGLEVAALGTCRSFPDGRPFAESLDEVRAAGVLAAIPWGFGKWAGARGRRVQRVVDGASRRAFLGDSGSRTWLLGEPTLIRRGRTAGALVLAGSDPFPFASDHRRVGAFGFLADFEPNLSGPWRSLRTWLAGLRESPLLYGRPSGPVRFLINQLGVRVYNRRVGSRSA